MTLQKSVLRQYTQGFIGEISADGPKRGNIGIITQNAPGGVVIPNRIGRGFTYAADVGGVPSTGDASTGTATMGWIEQRAIVGKDASDTNPRFFGILGIPKHFTLYGNSVDGPLGPTYDIPDNSEAEFMTMAIMNVAVANGSTAAGTLPYWSQVYMCIAAGTTESGGNGAPTGTRDIGRLYVFPTGAPSTESAGRFLLVPGCRTTTAITTNVAPATATADTGPVTDAGSVVVRIQLTN